MLRRVVGVVVTLASLAALIVAASAGPAHAESLGPVLQAGGILRAGDQMWSTEGGFAVVMQGDGNLVLYAPGSRPLWASNTAGHPGAWAQMQADGNFVVYEPGPRPLWASNTAGRPGAWVQIQTDGNFVVYTPGPRAVWASNTGAPAPPPPPAPRPVLTAGQGLAPGQSIVSPNGQQRVTMQSDGNLVAYAPGNRATWASNTAGHPGSWVQMQGDGNLVVYMPGPRALWASATATRGSWAQIQDDGNFVVYAPGPRPLWAMGRSLVLPPARPPATTPPPARPPATTPPPHHGLCDVRVGCRLDPQQAEFITSIYRDLATDGSGTCAAKWIVKLGPVAGVGAGFVPNVILSGVTNFVVGRLIMGATSPCTVGARQGYFAYKVWQGRNLSPFVQITNTKIDRRFLPDVCEVRSHVRYTGVDVTETVRYSGGCGL